PGERLGKLAAEFPSKPSSFRAMSPTRRSKIAARARARRWARLSDEQLLAMRFCDLKLSIQRAPLARHVRRLYADLERRGIEFRPHEIGRASCRERVDRSLAAVCCKDKCRCTT